MLRLPLEVVQGVDADHNGGKRYGNGGIGGIGPVLLPVDDEAVNGSMECLPDLQCAAGKLDEKMALADLGHLEAIRCEPLGNSVDVRSCRPKALTELLRSEPLVVGAGMYVLLVLKKLL